MSLEMRKSWPGQDLDGQGKDKGNQALQWKHVSSNYQCSQAESACVFTGHFTDMVSGIDSFHVDVFPDSTAGSGDLNSYKKPHQVTRVKWKPSCEILAACCFESVASGQHAGMVMRAVRPFAFRHSHESAPEVLLWESSGETSSHKHVQEEHRDS